MKTLTCWFPALEEDVGLGFIPLPSHRGACVLWGGCGSLEGKGGEQASVGQGGQREGAGGAQPLLLPVQTLGFPFPVGLGTVK